MILLNLVRRNLALYFNNRKRIFFSLFGVLISIILYFVFLKSMIQRGFSSIPDGVKLLDSWLIGGTVLLSAITTTEDSLYQKLYDRDSNRIKDLLVTDASYAQIDISYAISAWLIGLIMQFIVFVILSVIFMESDGLSIDISILPQLVLGMAVSSLVWTLFNIIIVMIIKSSTLVPSISSIISSCAGFFAGVYMPIGSLPTGAQTFLNYTPAPYGSAMFRDVLMHNQLQTSFQHVNPSVMNDFIKTMGLKINGFDTFNGNMMMSLLFVAIFLVVFFALLFINKKNA